MMTLVRTLLAFATFIAAAGPAAAAPDGERLFNQQCASCHVPGETSTAAGPALTQLIWRKVAAAPDYRYSPALRRLGGSWSPGRLDEYLKNTQALAPGTSMYFTIADPEERRAIIAYLRKTPRPD